MSGGRLRRLQDPVVLGAATAAGLVVVGGVAVGLSWRGTATTDSVRAQLPFVVSGVFGGLAAVIVGIAVLLSQLDRALATREAARLDRLAERLADAVDALG